MSVEQQTDKKYLTRYANVYSLTRTIPRDRRFNMDEWGRRDVVSECGTAACMAGHAGLHPWFRKRGFVLRPGITRDRLVTSDGWSPEESVEAFFGCYFDSDHPFSPNCYDTPPTPKQAAAALKRYMLKRWPKAEVDAAIATAEAVYDVKHVHRYAKWEAA